MIPVLSIGAWLFEHLASGMSTPGSCTFKGHTYQVKFAIRSSTLHNLEPFDSLYMYVYMYMLWGAAT